MTYIWQTSAPFVRLIWSKKWPCSSSWSLRKCIANQRTLPPMLFSSMVIYWNFWNREQLFFCKIRCERDYTKCREIGYVASTRFLVFWYDADKCDWTQKSSTNRVAWAGSCLAIEQCRQASYVLLLWCCTYHMINRLRTARYEVTTQRQCAHCRAALEQTPHGVAKKTTGCGSLSASFL